MCGIAAIFAYSPDAPNVERDELIAIRDHMTSRGPDGCGEFISPDRRLALGHRRLAILDLSDAGAQPMWSADKRYAIVFNGEIYNFRELRSSLSAPGRVFRSGTDTEVLLQLYAQHGAEMVHHLRGMFAFAIWDEREKSLFLARDPFGIKPLYYADDGRTIRIASQVKALLRSPHVDTTPEPAGHVGFFLWGSVPDPFTLYRGIKALPAGHALMLGENSQSKIQNPKSFCSVPDLLRATASGNSEFQLSAFNSQLSAALADTISHHLIADVPVGIFQSAGRDSSTLTSFVAAQRGNVRTVTLGFEEYRGAASDEVPLAETVARHFGTAHETIWVTRRDFESSADALFAAMDQPSIDGVNTYFVSKAARAVGLKVALSGLGADEIFGGYPSFREIPRSVRWLRAVAAVPALGAAFRIATAPMLKHLTSPKYAGLLEYGGTYGGAYLLRRGLFMPWELPEILDADLVREGWQRLNTLPTLSALAEFPLSTFNSPLFRLRISALELSCYMRHQLLRDTDWASMAHSLEVRVPFVDNALLSALAPLLASAKPPTKSDMTAAAPMALPAALLNRPKTGFTVPVRDWLQRSQPSTLNHQPNRERGLRGWAKFVYARFGKSAGAHRLPLHEPALAGNAIQTA